MTTYEKNIANRSWLRYIAGLIIRWKRTMRFRYIAWVARRHGATVGECVCMPMSLAKKANKNLIIGSHVVIQTDKIDMRSPVTIGNNVIIGSGSEIITTSHNIDSPDWEHKHYGICIKDYVWIPMKILVLPSCREIGTGAVVGSGSVVVKNIEAMSVVSGNPAKEFKKRKCLPTDLCVESMLSGDYEAYRRAWRMRKK